MLKYELAKQIAIEVVRFGAGIENNIRDARDTPPKTLEEKRDQLDADGTAKRVLTLAWSLVKIVTLFVIISDAFRGVAK